MRRLVMLVLAMLAVGILGSGTAVAQDTAGTINSLTVNPYENQELTGTMATTSGQPNDVTPGSTGEPNGLVPVTTSMEGSGSNGNVAQAPASAATAKTAVSAVRRNEEQAKQSAGNRSAAKEKEKKSQQR